MVEDYRHSIVENIINENNYYKLYIEYLTGSIPLDEFKKRAAKFAVPLNLVELDILKARKNEGSEDPLPKYRIFDKGFFKPYYRYRIVEKSISCHCCFDYTIVDTTVKDEHDSAMCECFNRDEAILICYALNNQSENELSVKGIPGLIDKFNSFYNDYLLPDPNEKTNH